MIVGQAILIVRAPGRYKPDRGLGARNSTYVEAGFHVRYSFAMPRSRVLPEVALDQVEKSGGEGEGSRGVDNGIED